MRFGFDNILGMNEKSLAVRVKRNELIANNLINADTPNYKARDIDFREVLATASENNNAGKLLKTNSRHISVSTSDFDPLIKYRVPTQPSLDGNTVDEHAEKAAFGENAVRYQASLHFLDRKFKGIVKAFKGE